jgi:hypothetical protein
MTSLTESLREKLMHEATFMDASGKAAVQRCIHIITTLKQPTNDVERVREAFERDMKPPAIWEELSSWNDAYSDYSKGWQAALTQKQEDL